VDHGEVWETSCGQLHTTYTSRFIATLQGRFLAARRLRYFNLLEQNNLTYTSEGQRNSVPLKRNLLNFISREVAVLANETTVNKYLTPAWSAKNLLSRIFSSSFYINYTV
jgi:hypothetical protein